MSEKNEEELRQEIESLRLALAERNKNAGKRATVDFGKMMTELNEGAGELIDTVQPHAKAVMEGANKKIKQHPFASICAAFSAGVVIAALARGNKNKAGNKD